MDITLSSGRHVFVLVSMVFSVHDLVVVSTDAVVVFTRAQKHFLVGDALVFVLSLVADAERNFLQTRFDGLVFVDMFFDGWF